MKKLIAIFLVILTFFWCLTPLPVFAFNLEVGQQVKLKAKTDLGIPLHRKSSSSLVERIQDGTWAQVLDTAKEKHWLNIKTADGKTGWVIDDYVSQVLNRPILPNHNNNKGNNIGNNGANQVWTSANGCDAVVKDDKLLPRSSSNILRLGSWNIRWFPDGRPTSVDSNLKTDLDWLACAIAWMDVDILAVQEIKTTTEAQNAWNKVTRQLKNYTGDNWEVILNSCGNSNNQHLGFLYNANKVKYTERKEVWQFNGKANSASNPCINNLRPGYLAYFQSKVDNGFDFYAIAVHLDSGQTDRDLSNRQTAIARIDEVTKPLEAIDGDIVILGDFNTMGINQGISAKEEIKELKEKVVTESPGFELLTVQPSCTHYYQKKPGWLDQILVSQDTKELINNNAYVQGYCALNSCNSLNGSLPDAALSLSDHCPVIVDFNNSDLD